MASSIGGVRFCGKGMPGRGVPPVAFYRAPVKGNPANTQISFNGNGDSFCRSIDPQAIVEKVKTTGPWRSEMQERLRILMEKMLAAAKGR